MVRSLHLQTRIQRLNRSLSDDDDEFDPVLQLQQQQQAKKQEHESDVESEEEEAEEYDIDRVVGHQQRKNGTFFKVRWLGYTEADDTWEPESSLTENGTEKLDEYWGSNKVVEYDTKGKIIKNKAPRSSLGPASGSKKVTSSAGSSASPAIKRRKIEDEEVDDEVSFSKKSRQSDAPSSAKRKRIIAAEESEEELEDIVVPKKAPANGSAAKSTTNGTAAKTKGRKSVDADDKPVSAARKKGRPSASAKKEGGRKSGSAPSVEMDVEVGGDGDDYGTDVEVVDIEEEMGNRKNWDGHVEVDTIERPVGEEPKDLKVLLSLKKNEKQVGWVTRDLANARCPLTLIYFYEKHIIFRPGPKGKND